MPSFLLVRSPDLEASWPFVHQRLIERLAPLGATRVLELPRGEALSLALAGLRRLPQWHAQLAAGERSFTYEATQYCDATGFANGELGAKRVGVIGLGQIGGRVARWCLALWRGAGPGA